MDGESGSQGTGRISVIDPLSPAMDWARDVLFRPFDLVKWLVLGFCAWLAMLGRGGAGSGSSGVDSGDIEHRAHEAWEWVLTHLLPVLFIALVLIIIVVAIWLLVLWLSSRGKFMFLDGVVNNRAAVVEPWHRFRALANSVFVLRIILSLIGFAAVVVILAFIGLLVWLGSEGGELEPLLIPVVILAVMAILATVIVFALVGLAINEFLVPLMYLRDCGVAAAWRELRGLLSARPGKFVLYVLVKIVLALVVVAVTLIACCLTCCILLLPYIGTVILLPLWVFLRAYPLYFLGQFGPQYSRFATLGPEVDPSGGEST